MGDKRGFSVAVFGLTDIERRVVRSLCVVSGSLPRAYAVAPEHSADEANVLIVDCADPQSLAALAAARAKRRVLAVLVGSTDPAGDAEICLRRPLVASRLLQALDTLVTREPAHVPVQGNSEGRPAPAAIGAMNLREHPAALQAKRFTALVIDDSVTIRKQVELALRLHDVEPTGAETGEAAMALLAKQHYDLIFLDVVLPGGADGYQICRSIKKNETHRSTPVIMLTGRSSAFERMRGSLAGCDSYLTKPVDNHTFDSVLEKFLKVTHAAHAA